MSKTINEALKDVFLNLGGNPSELSDNSTVSDYIEDLGSAIKAEASSASEALIDDTKKGAKTTYSSNKIEDLIPEGLPAVTSSDKFKIMQVDANAQWSKIDLISCFYKGGFIPGEGANAIQLFKQLTETELYQMLFTCPPINDTVVFCTQIRTPGGNHSPAKYQGIIRETGKTIYYTFEVADNTPPFTDIPVTVTVVNDPA